MRAEATEGERHGSIDARENFLGGRSRFGPTTCNKIAHSHVVLNK